MTTELAQTRVASPQKRVAADTIAGWSALVFLILVVIQNLLKTVTNPPTNAGAADLLQFVQGEAWTVNLLVVTYIIGFPALFLFAAGLAARAQRANPDAEIWGKLGRASVGVIAVLFGFINIMQIVMVAAQSTLATQPALITLLWTLHNAVFTLNLVAVGGALLGLSRAAALGGLIPRPLGYAAACGATFLGAAAAPAVAEVHGSPVLGLGLVGFLCWLIFLALAGVGLLRANRG